MTLAQLSERTGISLSTISNYEHGRAIPRLESAFRLAYVLGINLNVIAAKIARTDRPAHEQGSEHQEVAA